VEDRYVIRRPWLLPVTLPLTVIWAVLRTARLPLNLGLWAVGAGMELLVLHERPRWPTWRSIWGYF
jgi:hypothetical protein